ncbi:MAG: glycoside hydrolase family 2 protein [Lachnospiraceae bacterium]
MVQLQTDWEVDKAGVHQEYPRPQLVRSSYLNLNGIWQYEVTKTKDAAHMQGRILVPFSPETMLSGVERILQPEEYLYYERSFVLPDGFRKSHVLLHFGGVDQECEVLLNQQLVGCHKGGYTAFSIDVTDYLVTGENRLTVIVRDRTEYAPHGRGKQKLKKHGKMSYLYYTPQSGIWKTVWMESVPENYIREVKITPLYDESKVLFEIPVEDSSEMMEVKIFDGDHVIWQRSMAACTQFTAALDSFCPWTPECPHLYDVQIRRGEDEVQTYFGMRKISVERDSHGILRFFLNNQPYFFNGVLDQGYWPESLMTPPTDEALKYDILKLKEMGFNTIRKHIKVESDRFYYHCDRIGMVVWQDMPNGGGDYDMTFVTYLPNSIEAFQRAVKDNHYAAFKRSDEIGRLQFCKDLKEIVHQLYNHPSIMVWTPFNEGWGQFDAAKATKILRQIGGNRLINEACGWFDQGGGDIYSIHDYIHKLQVKPEPKRVVALTEYGGYAYEVPEHTACKKKFGYKRYRNEGEFMVSYAMLWEEQIYPNLSKGLSAAIYTQTSDIEEEINGLMTYDRKVDKCDMESVREINCLLYEKWKTVVGSD